MVSAAKSLDPSLAVAPRVRPATELSPATERAYASDLNDIVVWSRTRGINESRSALDERHVFAYLVDQVRAGRTPSTIRRRLTALRSADAAGGVGIVSAEALFDLERRVLHGRASRTGVLVASDDPIIRAGLRAVLSDAGVMCWSEPVVSIDPATLTVWDYVLVWASTTLGADRFDAVRRLRSIDPMITNQVPIIAVYPGNLSRMVRLRLAEAGVRYAIPHEWLSAHLGELSQLLAAAEIPARFHLETPLALRQQLGLKLGGDLEALLAAASSVPQDVWQSDLPQSKLPISRKEILMLRRVALESAGVPEPQFNKYATSLRRAPTLPEWTRVREVVRAAFDS